MSISLTIITGFLGSGKTTFLKRLVARYAGEEKIGVIQNEFAPLNVDGRELKHSGKTFELMEINRGSAFCVCLVAEFKTALADFIRAHQPQRLFLEASGLSDPIAVTEILGAAELKDVVHLGKICCIVDAMTFLPMERMNLRLQHQVRVADVVLVNKSDMAKDESKAEVVERVRQINPLADVLITAYCDFDMAILDSAHAPVAEQQASALTSHEALSRPTIGTAVVKSTRKISRAALERFLREQATRSYRIKGHVQLNDGTAIMVQSTMGDVSLSPLEVFMGPTEIIAIGPEIDAKEFSQRFRQLVE
ncbi:GTP-binding protein [candidate division KSB1 bacterium]|nr:GTP-binding protein [candidate division KSB1 bacterium]